MKKFIALSALILLPGLAFAQTIGVSSLVYDLGQLLKSIVPILTVIAVLAFMYSIIRFLFAATSGDVEKKKMFQSQILWELLALVLLFAWFGVVKIIANSTGLGGAVGQDINNDDIPKVNFSL